MKVELLSFQKKAVNQLRLNIDDAQISYRLIGQTQVVSLQAPTGSGKTIIAASLIEDIFWGTSFDDGRIIPEQPNAIFVWLSDSPELNEQSRQKIELKTSKLRIGQCITISEESFDKEMLEDGHIYFLNTQKVSRSSKLVRHSDNRQYTIWETLDNTIQNKSDRLYFIIDEAHRGAKSKTESGRDTTIMQRFIKGYEYKENNVDFQMKPMPIVLGISATAERFNTLVKGIDAGFKRYTIPADAVRKSGLLKERIVITYPGDSSKNNDNVLLAAAVEEWNKKCKRWYQYTFEQHYANIDPILVIQVCQGSNGALSATNLDDVLAKIEETLGTKFKMGEVVHCFGGKATIEINGLSIPYVNASEIVDDHKIKVVFFKEALSTGWDCPRAETMMSFAKRNDPTYIAQLLGRMVRTPMQMRVQHDEFLNDVKLYLPYFDRETVKQVIDELQTNEGGDIPTEINGESLEEPAYISWTARAPRPPRNVGAGSNTPTLPGANWTPTSTTLTTPSPITENVGFYSNPGSNFGNEESSSPPILVGGTGDLPTAPIISSGDNQGDNQPAIHPPLGIEINRMEIIDFINEKAYLTYFVRRERVQENYLRSLQDFVCLLTQYNIYREAREVVVNDVIQMIREYIEDLHNSGKYETLATQVLQFKLLVQVFSPLGDVLQDNASKNLTLFSESDLDRQLHITDEKLGKFGFHNIYGQRYYDEENTNAFKVDCILFALDEVCMKKLGDYAQKKINDLSNKYRVAATNKSDKCRREYRTIMGNCEEISEQSFAIPENIMVREDSNGVEYDNHLLVSPITGTARIKLNGWETELIKEESERSDFVCWLRNIPRAAWALCLPYDVQNEHKSFFPDFLIIRRNFNCDDKYVVDILEPHGPQYADNLTKAVALAKYANNEQRLGRIQLIRMQQMPGGDKKLIRLNLTDPETNKKVRNAMTNDELDHIFDIYGVFENE